MKSRGPLRRFINTKNRGPLGMPRLTGLGPLVKGQKFEDIDPEWFTDHAFFKSIVRERSGNPFVTVPVNERRTVEIREGDPVDYVAFRDEDSRIRVRRANIGRQGQLELDSRFEKVMGDRLQFMVVPRGEGSLVIDPNRIGVETMLSSAIFKAPVQQTNGTGQINVPKQEWQFFGEREWPAQEEAVAVLISMEPPDGPTLDEQPLYRLPIVHSRQNGDLSILLDIPADVMDREGFAKSEMVQAIVVPPTRV